MQTIIVKDEKNFANQINEIMKIEEDTVLVCSGSINIENEVVEKLTEILHDNEHHAVVGLTFLQKSQVKEISFNFFDIVPFVSSKCFMLRVSTLKNLGGVDSKISDHDLCLAEYCARINQYGYSTVQAHFSTPLVENSKNLKGFTENEMLSISEEISKKYPVVKRVVKNYFSFKEDPLKHFEPILNCASNGKPRILFSFQNLMASFNGTAEYSFALLRPFVLLYGDKYDIDIIVYKDAWSFHARNFPEKVTVYFFNQDEEKLPLYDMIFSSSQIWEMKYLYLFNRLSPRIIVAILDAIVWRSGYLDVFHASGHTFLVNNFVMRFCNGFLAISETARKDILSFFHNADTSNLLTVSTLLGHNFKFQEEDKIQNKMLTSMYNEEIGNILEKKYVLVFGNGLKHKSVREVHDAIVDVNVYKVYIGMNGGKFKNEVNTSFLHSGGIPDDLMQKLYQNAHLLIFPSQYEGFGLPIIKAVEYGKKIVLLNNEINREVVEKFIKNAGQAVFFDLFSQLPKLLNENMDEYIFAKTQMRTWEDVACETEDFFQKILQTEINQNNLRDRWFILRLMELENSDFQTLKKFREWLKNFSVRAKVLKKKFFPKKLF